MKHLFTLILIFSTISLFGQYTPSQHQTMSKPIGITIAAPTDARSYYYNSATFSYRPYASTSEVLSYLNTTTKRTGNFPIYVDVGGGTIVTYSFKNGTDDNNLVVTIRGLKEGWGLNIDSSGVNYNITVDSNEIYTDILYAKPDSTGQPNAYLEQDTLKIRSDEIVFLDGSYTVNYENSTNAKKRAEISFNGLVFRTGSTTSSATPSINTDNYDIYKITALAANITSMTTNLSGTPNDGDILQIQITDNGSSKTITWGSSFASSSVSLPTSTTSGVTLTIILQYYVTSSYGNNKWICTRTF